MLDLSRPGYERGSLPFARIKACRCFRARSEGRSLFLLGTAISEPSRSKTHNLSASDPTRNAAAHFIFPFERTWSRSASKRGVMCTAEKKAVRRLETVVVGCLAPRDNVSRLEGLRRRQPAEGTPAPVPDQEFPPEQILGGSATAEKPVNVAGRPGCSDDPLSEFVESHAIARIRERIGQPTPVVSVHLFETLIEVVRVPCDEPWSRSPCPLVTTSIESNGLRSFVQRS
jgi:hypothetical protein